MMNSKNCRFVSLLWAITGVLCTTSVVMVDAAAYDPRMVGNTLPDTIPQESLISIDDDSMISQRLVGQSQYNKINRGGGLIPAGYNPFGYKVTPLGEQFLEFSGSLDSDVGRFLASIKERKTLATIKTTWLEIVRVSKKSQSMRIYRNLQDLIEFCLSAGFID